MTNGPLIAACVNAETKSRFRALAQRHELSESAFLKRLIHTSLESAAVACGEPLRPVPRVLRGERLCVRLRTEDQRLLRERAACRSMPPATYVSVLIRSHLRQAAPLPKEELLVLRRAVAELGAIGRNINQIAKAANQGASARGPDRGDLRSILGVCMGLRDHVKALLKSNAASWEQDHA